MQPRSPAMLLCILACALPACGDEDEAGADAAVSVVATTTQLADIARNVGGDRVDVEGVLEANSDAHDYEPRPSDAEAVAGADLTFRSGGDVDFWLDDLIDNAGGDAEVVTLADSVQTREVDGELDPHWWQDPRNGVLAAEAIREALTEADPDGAAVYEQNAQRYSAELVALDRGIASCVERIPPGKRKLVTTHDALGYYAERYGLEVVGALIPSTSSQAQPSAGDTQDLADQIRSEGVEAIFPESSLNPKLEEAVSRETGAEVGRALYADALGSEGSPGETYVGSLVANTEAIVEGLSGGRLRCTPDTRRAG